MTEVEVLAVNENLTVICNMDKGDVVEPFYNRIYPLWKVTFVNSGAEYSLDLTCAQFGRYSPAIKWDVFKKLWCNYNRENADGTTASFFFTPGQKTPTEICQLRFATLLVLVLTHWDETCGEGKHADRHSLGKFFWLPNEAYYQRHRDYLLSMVGNFLNHYRSEEETNPKFSISQKTFLLNIAFQNRFKEYESPEEVPHKATNPAAIEKKPREPLVTEEEGFLRAAETLQELWYIFCENTFIYPIMRVKRSLKTFPDNEIPYLECFVPTTRSMGTCQYNKLPSNVSREERHAILSHTEAPTVMALFEDFVDYFLEGKQLFRDIPLAFRLIIANDNRHVGRKDRGSRGDNKHKT